MGNFAEWHTGLGHSIGTGIHAQKNRFFRAATIMPDELIVSPTSIFQWIISILYWMTERKVRQLVVQIIDDLVPGCGHVLSFKSKVTGECS